MAANARPIWILLRGCHPIALASLTKKKRFPPGAIYWCHEGDEKWLPITAADRARLERWVKKKSRSR